MFATARRRPRNNRAAACLKSGNIRFRKDGSNFSIDSLERRRSLRNRKRWPKAPESGGVEMSEELEEEKKRREALEKQLEEMKRAQKEREKKRESREV